MNNWCVVFLSCFFFLSACQKPTVDPSPTTVEKQLTVNKLSIVMSGAASFSDTIQVTSNSTWKIEVSPRQVTWIKLDVLSGTGNKAVVLTELEKNTGNADRAAVIKISLGDSSKSVEIAVTQKKMNSPNSVDDKILWREKITFINVNGSTKEVNTLPRNEQYFSTVDPTVTQPIGETEARKRIDKIDLVYFYVHDYSDIGFIDPVTASAKWYWDYVNKPWLASALKTNFYITKLTKPQFDSARSNTAMLDKYFKDTLSVRLAPHRIYPNGTCIGGRNAGDMVDPVLKKGSELKKREVYGFMNVVSGKKGLIYIRPDQVEYWDVRLWVSGNPTVVDIIKQK
jgi:hypothetical protein